jgi:hypothetical protein
LSKDDVMGAATCTDCPKGKTSVDPATGEGTLCGACAAGMWSNTGSIPRFPGDIACTKCEAGRFAEAGQYGQRRCKGCVNIVGVKGLTSIEGATSVSQCVPKTALSEFSEVLAQSSTLELAVGAVAALAVVGTAFMGTLMAVEKYTNKATAEETAPLIVADEEKA